MTQTRSLLLVLAASACEQEVRQTSLIENQDSRVVAVIEGCEAWTGVHKEWCSLQAMGSANLSGSLVPAVCERMVTQEVADQCWEMAVRQGNAPGEEELCDRIESDLLRDSCHLVGVGREMPSEADDDSVVELSELLELCDRTGDMRSVCASYLLEIRQDIWAASGEDRHTHMTHEVRQMVSIWLPVLKEDRDFGSNVGFAAYDLEPELGEIGACVVFPYGPPKLACVHAASTAQ
jgi:hypothetical protein